MNSSVLFANCNFNEHLCFSSIFFACEKLKREIMSRNQILGLIAELISMDNTMDVVVQTVLASESTNSLLQYLQNDHRERNDDFYKEAIPRFHVDDFRRHFRMSRTSIEVSFD